MVQKYFRGGNIRFFFGGGSKIYYTKINNNSESFSGAKLLLWGGFAPLASLASDLGFKESWDVKLGQKDFRLICN